MGQILNDAKAKFYKKNRTLLQTLIDNCPMTDGVFNEILEAYEADEDATMDMMINCEEGKFERDFSGGWNFETND